ncbi:doublecortin domain-containing protein 2-like [Carcharodon carcharias]|uniref:doublecortin domain-containing protein 2-like n=1 Tax=Carcharodon carcharias TaxID=13397 RepID=UPI001B7E54EA|nr:doublecortin domain-containing protein 2-like [Carcharodon carcharias]
MATTKPTFLAQPAVKCVRVYRNGDPFYGGRKFVINERQISTFEAFLKEVTNGLEAPFGAVRNIYTPQQGHRVYQLEELDTGKQYVAGGKERFKKLDYIQIGIKKKKPLTKDVQIKPVAHSRIIASARFRKHAQEPCIICVFTNGDPLSPAIRLLIPKRILGQWEQVLSSITEKVNLRTGAVRKLHTLDGRSINDGTELENGGYYVAVGRDKFKKLPYGELIFSKSYLRRSNGSKAASLPPIPGSKKKEHRPAETVDEEEHPLVLCEEESSCEGDGNLPNVEWKLRNDVLNDEEILTICHAEEDLRRHDLPHKEVKTSEESETDHQVEEEISDPAEEEVEDIDPREANQEDKYFHQNDLPHKEDMMGEENGIDHQVEEEISDPAEEEVDDIDPREAKQEDKYFHQNDLPHKEEMMGEENGIDHQVEEISDPAEEEVEDVDQMEKDQEDKYFHQNDLPHKEETVGEETGIDHQGKQEIADSTKGEQDIDQKEENYGDKYFHHQEDEFQKEDLHQESEDSSAEGEARLEEIDKDNEVIPTEEHSKVMRF